jgi:hypothetical protein
MSTDVRPGQIYRQDDIRRDLWVVLAIHVGRQDTLVEIARCDEAGRLLPDSLPRASLVPLDTFQDSTSTGYREFVGQADEAVRW